MKKFLIFILSLVVILSSLSSCYKNNNNNNTVSISEPVNYKFYVEYAWGDTIPEKTTDFEAVSELNLGLALKRITLNNVDKTKKVVVDGKDIELEYQNTQVIDENNLNFSNYNRAFNCYEIYDYNNYISIKVRIDTGDISYYDTGVNNSWDTPLLSDNEYENIAINELNARLPSGWNDTYSVCVISNNESNGFIRATFTRPKFFGCELRDPIHVYMDYDGKVYCFDTRQYGLFDEVVKEITKEQLDAAYNALKEKLDPNGSKNALNTTRHLFLDNTGTVYMSVSYNEVVTDKNGDECNHNAMVYVNVN